MLFITFDRLMKVHPDARTSLNDHIPYCALMKGHRGLTDQGNRYE